MQVRRHYRDTACSLLLGMQPSLGQYIKLIFCLQKTVNRVYGIVTALVVLTSIILCAIQGANHHLDYLLVANIIRKSFIMDGYSKMLQLQLRLLAWMSHT